MSTPTTSLTSIAIENIRDYRRNFVSFIASVILGGLAISILSSVMFSYLNGTALTQAAWASLLVAGGLLLASAFAYAGTQNLHLVETKTWDSSIILRMDGTAADREITDTFRSSQFKAVQAYSQLLNASKNKNDVRPEMPGIDLTDAGVKVSIVNPPGDRAGPNQIEQFTRELIDYLILWWLSWLRRDVYTEEGKIKPRIEFFQNPNTQKYPLEALKRLIGANRFLELNRLTDDLGVELPDDISLTVSVKESVLPKFELVNKAITIALRYSIIRVTRTVDTFECKFRITFSLEPHKLWSPRWKRLLKHRDVFSSDKYFRGAEELLQNLISFFPPL